MPTLTIAHQEQRTGERESYPESDERRLGPIRPGVSRERDNEESNNGHQGVEAGWGTRVSH
jgi:hypothetical protein